MDRLPLPGSRPTLPSLRSQVGEYLPEPHPRELYQLSHAPDSYHSHRRQSITSLTMSPGRRSSFSRPHLPDDRSLSSSAGPHPSSAMQSGSGSYTSGASQPPMNATRSTVSVACTNCRSAHLACSETRPCRRCVQTGRSATCIDVEPRKRGRPRASEAPPITNTMATTMVHSLTESSRSGRMRYPSEDLTIIMSTSLRCARVSERLTHILGYDLQTMLEQPLSTFISREEKQDYARFSLRLLAYPGVASRPVPVSSQILHQTPYNELITPLAGAPTHVHPFRIRTIDGTLLPFRFESYLGAGFGAHPAKPDSLRLAYVVLRLTLLTNDESSRHSSSSFRSPSSSGESYCTNPSTSNRSSSRSRGDGRGYDDIMSDPRPYSQSGIYR
ncbi:hypothetical protein DFH28DRAFT_284587 [Melampsora americana]|nr:hypothetical protein DFH28DRAFT_284587 [Melampsora americana]